MLFSSDSEDLRSWRASVEMQRREQKENEAILSDGSEELEFSITDDEVGEEERGSAPLVEACRKNMTGVSVCCSCCIKVELSILRACCQQMVSLLLIAGADVTLCDRSRRTALHESPPELQEKVLRWMLKPNMPPHTELLQAGTLWRPCWYDHMRGSRSANKSTREDILVL